MLQLRISGRSIQPKMSLIEYFQPHKLFLLSSCLNTLHPKIFSGVWWNRAIQRVLGLCLTPVRNSELGKVEPTHICANHLVDCGVVCFAEVYSVIGRFKAIPAPPVVWKMHALSLPSTQHCRSLQREFPCTWWLETLVFSRLLVIAWFWFCWTRMAFGSAYFKNNNSFTFIFRFDDEEEAHFLTRWEIALYCASQPSSSLRTVCWKEKKTKTRKKKWCFFGTM